MHAPHIAKVHSEAVENCRLQYGAEPSTITTLLLLPFQFGYCRLCFSRPRISYHHRLPTGSDAPPASEDGRLTKEVWLHRHLIVPSHILVRVNTREMDLDVGNLDHSDSMPCVKIYVQWHRGIGRQGSNQNGDRRPRSRGSRIAVSAKSLCCLCGPFIVVASPSQLFASTSSKAAAQRLRLDRAPARSKLGRCGA